MPNCLGALDGKHVHMRPPFLQSPMYYNYKGTHSIILMALVDAEYRFLYVDVGCNGKVNDAGVFAATTLYDHLERRSAVFPEPEPLPGDDRPVSYLVVADEAFGLRENVMKPFPYRDLQKEHRIYNYRLSRARRCVENAFGILANRWRLFLTAIPLQPDKVETLVMAGVALHNMLRTEIGFPHALHDTEDVTTHELTEGSWRTDSVLSRAQIPAGTNVTNRAKTQRNYLADYFNSETGSVPWQDSMI